MGGNIAISCLKFKRATNVGEYSSENCHRKLDRLYRSQEYTFWAEVAELSLRILKYVTGAAHGDCSTWLLLVAKALVTS